MGGIDGRSVDAVAEKNPLVGQAGLVSFVPRHPPDAKLRRAIGHQQFHRARTLHLHADPTGALLIRAQEDVQRRGVAEQRHDALGVAAPVQHALPGPRKAGEAAPDVELLEQEALHIVGLHGSKVYLPHHAGAVDGMGFVVLNHRVR